MQNFKEDSVIQPRMIPNSDSIKVNKILVGKKIFF